MREQIGPPDTLKKSNDSFMTRARTFSYRHRGKVVGSIFSLGGGVDFVSGHPAVALGETVFAAGNFVADAKKSSSRKKAAREGSEVLGSKNLRRFRATETNEEADLLQKYIGISIPADLKKVRLQGRDRLVRALDNSLQAAFPRRAGGYDPEYNAVFSGNKTNKLDLLSEAILGYIDQTNSAFLNTHQEYQRAMIAVREGRAAVDFPVEKYTVMDSFRFGLSTLIASGAIRIEIEDSKLQGSDWASNLSPILLEAVIQSPLTEEEMAAKISDKFGLLHEYTNSLREIFGRTGKTFARRKKEISIARKSRGFKTFLGAAFGMDALIILASNSFEPKEAIDLLINNPPETIEDLANPELFIQNKFGYI